MHTKSLDRQFFPVECRELPGTGITGITRKLATCHADHRFYQIYPARQAMRCAGSADFNENAGEIASEPGTAMPPRLPKEKGKGHRYRWPSSLTDILRAGYLNRAARLRQKNPSNPANPAPRIASDDGSGTVEGA